jgi:hypothetical protein
MARQAIVFVAACTLVSAFFLPWMEGEGELRDRAFSGFDFARLIRNFEITAASPSGVGQLRATAVAIYLVPALAVNVAMLSGLALMNRRWIGAARLACALGAAYAMAVLGVLLLLSALPVTDLAGVLGRPEYGYAATAVAAFVMGGIGLEELWRSPTARNRRLERLTRKPDRWSNPS